ncbi:SDR family NAD(P)-dependent oxidoreductase [Luminiphilus sp.]|jgi:short-subunit dehydrogenase|nr:SDR family NAD(P)-dependent oxidoreductase [Luminiphilus sp.]
MKNLKQKVAVVTGAGSGIGRATALALANEGCLLAISDISESNLEETRLAIEALDVKVLATVLDVADRDAFEKYASDVAATFGKVNIVINNAGVIVRSSLQNISMEDFHWIMNINFWGMVYGSMAFLPYLKESGEGHICNVSSMFGMMAPANVGAYAAGKFAVRAFSETLRTELDVEECGVSVTSIHPGMIKTTILRDGRLDPSLLAEIGAADKEEAHAQYIQRAFNTPERVADSIVKGIKKNKMRVLVGFDAYVVDWATRLTPVLFRRLATRILKIDKAKRQKTAAAST